MNELFVSIKRVELCLKISEVYSLCINRVTLQYNILKKAQVAQLVERNFEGV